jgi:seryl-tRNA synthetase
MAKVAEAKQSISTLEKEVRESEEQLRSELSEIPNLPADDVPDGDDQSGNIEREDHRFGAKPSIKSPKQHFELGEALRLMDFETAAKLSGSRFVVLKGALARLERAISQFFLDVRCWCMTK